MNLETLKTVPVSVCIVKHFHPAPTPKNKVEPTKFIVMGGERESECERVEYSIKEKASVLLEFISDISRDSKSEMNCFMNMFKEEPDLTVESANFIGDKNVLCALLALLGNSSLGDPDSPPEPAVKAFSGNMPLARKVDHAFKSLKNAIQRESVVASENKPRSDGYLAGSIWAFYGLNDTFGECVDCSMLHKPQKLSLLDEIEVGRFGKVKLIIQQDGKTNCDHTRNTISKITQRGYSVIYGDNRMSVYEAGGAKSQKKNCSSENCAPVHITILCNIYGLEYLDSNSDKPLDNGRVDRPHFESYLNTSTQPCPNKEFKSGNGEEKSLFAANNFSNSHLEDQDYKKKICNGALKFLIGFSMGCLFISIVKYYC